jgi:predicted DNA-binding protein with PD1-like motif
MECYAKAKGKIDMLSGKVGRVCFSRLFEGEDLAEAIKKRAEENGIKAGMFLLIGTLKEAVLGYYRAGQHQPIRLDGSLEIASCTGTIAVDEKGEVAVHAHMVVSNEKSETFGGHLMTGSHVGIFAEIAIVEALGVNLQRVFDEKTKLRLLKSS